VLVEAFVAQPAIEVFDNPNLKPGTFQGSRSCTLACENLRVPGSQIAFVNVSLG
jgi:hypothetical protein